MELRHLAYFVAVAEERNFTRASRRLHTVQSGVSAAIKTLEHDLGAQLLERSSKRVDLTEAGRALLPQARLTLEAARAARDAVDEVTSGVRGTLRIGSITTAGSIDLPSLLGAFRRLHPRVTVHLSAHPSGSRGLTDALVDGRLDIAFVSLPGVRSAGLTVRHLMSVPLDLLVHADHVLATTGEVALADLADEPFVDFPAGYGNRAVTDQAFAAAGVTRTVVVEIFDAATGASYVRQGLGIALLPRHVIPPGDDLRRIAVTDADLSWPIAVAVPADRTPSAAARVLLRLLDEHELPRSVGESSA